MKYALGLPLLVASAGATTYFKEEFGEGWESRWIPSKHKSDFGVLAASHGKFYGDAKINMGMQTSQDAKFYSTGAAFPAFSNKGKDLVLQFSVKHEQKIDCGGGYLKFLPDGADLAGFHGESPYNIMFGPDICGSATKRIHVIFNYKGENKLITKTIAPETDEVTHVYTLVVRPDQTYEVFVDQKSKASGSLVDDWEFLEPKKIRDPSLSKPADWVDAARIDDPSDVKPAGYDDIPETLVDPEATKPEDWDDEMDGEWEAPIIPNPEFKGPFVAKQMDNPDYKGPWVHPEIDNPAFVEDNNIYAFDSFGAVALDVWQVKSGSIFDNVFIGDDLAEAEAFAAATYGATIEGEKAMKAAEEEADRKKQEEEAAARASMEDEFAEDEIEQEREELREEL